MEELLKKILSQDPTLLTRRDELIKILLPTRHFDLEDLIIDVVSVAAGAFAVVMFRKIRNRLLKRSP